MHKYQNIKLKTLNGRWSAIDEYSDGEADYILFECITFAGALNILCQELPDNQLYIVGKTDEFKVNKALEKNNEKRSEDMMQGRPRCKPATYNVYTEYEKVPVLMTIQQAAVLLQLSERTVLNLVNNGEIEAIKIGNQWRISKDNLLKMGESA